MPRDMRSHGRFMTHPGILVGLALLLVTQACEATDRETSSPAPPADTIQCTTAPDREGGGKLAAGLIVQCTVLVDSAATYDVEGQLYQDRRRGPVSFANQQGVDMSRSAISRGRPTSARALRPGPLEVRLWFPGSEIHHRAHRGDAWVDIQVQVSDTSMQLPRSRAEMLAQRAHWYRCRIARVDPAAFIARLPGQDIPPPLPRP
jgi:hypothetical protein